MSEYNRFNPSSYTGVWHEAAYISPRDETEYHGITIKLNLLHANPTASVTYYDERGYSNPRFIIKLSVSIPNKQRPSELIFEDFDETREYKSSTHYIYETDYSTYALVRTCDGLSVLVRSGRISRDFYQYIHGRVSVFGYRPDCLKFRPMIALV